MNKRVLVISPHADDATIFIGGTIKNLANQGYKVYIARVTNDDYDSYYTDSVTAIINNRTEAEAAYAVLGVEDVIHLGYESDNLNEVCYKTLRGDIVKLIRSIQPFELFSFDYDSLNENNMDHKIIANATAEALWISSFPLHYKEQLNEGLSCFSVPVRKRFSREGGQSYKCEDIESVIDDKIKALCKHKTALHNMLMQEIKRAEAFGVKVKEKFCDDELFSFVELMAKEHAQSIGRAYGVKYGEMIYEESLGLTEYLMKKGF